MGSLRILSIAAMFAGVFGIGFKIARYIYVYLKSTRNVAVDAVHYYKDEVTPFKPLEKVETEDLMDKMETPPATRPNSPNISGRHIGKPIFIVTKICTHHNPT